MIATTFAPLKLLLSLFYSNENMMVSLLSENVGLAVGAGVVLGLDGGRDGLVLLPDQLHHVRRVPGNDSGR